MRGLSRSRVAAGAGLLAGALVAGGAGAAGPAWAQSGPVGTVPAAGTPALESGAGAPYEAVNALKQCGGTVYAGGTFTVVTQGGADYRRSNLFSFSATAPYKITSWDPRVNGSVQTLAFDGANCGQVYVGGSFSRIGGTRAADLAAVSTATGRVVAGFAHAANGAVDTLAVSGSHLLTGGAFTEINGSPADPYYASLNVATGRNDGYLDLHISGTYSYPGVDQNTTKIYNQQVSHAGARVMVEGVFTSAGGQARQQIFQMWLGPRGGQVTGWNAPVFDTHCITQHPFYAYDAAWAPSDNVVYVATTGYHVYDWDNTYPLPPPCDMTLAFSGNESSQRPSWTDPTGCYSLYSVIADDYAVYVAGHPLYGQNPDGCKTAGPGAVPDPGLQGLSPTTGGILLNSQGSARYSMSRANGSAMVLTSAGLWIGSTNRYGSDVCDHQGGHAGICFLPYPRS